ncbi:MAG: hypothetical protein BM563_06075 [Bacteroidetes bacterium MedPE-SWsnd-G1]|nr:MAG: hypothetical protein BM563_06075 [Bacteroidetes bacterium MedPE-SWsnd-G1]
MPVIAQFSGSNLTELQYGELPGDPESFGSIYNKLNLNYGYKNFKFSAGAQLYQTPYSDRNYFEPAWINANYLNKGWNVNIGNFNETIGRGILLRSYEIPGGLLEDITFRSKNYFYRDILGGSVEYKNKKYFVKGMWGYSLNNVIPPTQDFDLRREDEILAFSGGYHFYKQTFEASFLKVKNSKNEASYGLGSLSGTISPSLSYYTAYSFYLDGDFENYEASNTYALYGSLNYAKGKFGGSFEVKDYSNFLIGTGINEPPALVKEHTSKLLNRSTHVLIPQNERGIQLEAYYQPSLFNTFTINYTLADNSFEEQTFKYREVFFEATTSVGKGTDLKFFIDYAEDPFKGEDDRISAGAFIEQSFNNDKYGAKLESEWQQFERDDSNVQNIANTLTFRKASKIYVSIISEVSTDPFLVSDSKSKKSWFGGSLKYQLNNKHSFQLFGGERRGGPACNAGVCYEVLDFKGVELRWNARF